MLGKPDYRVAIFESFFLLRFNAPMFVGTGLRLTARWAIDVDLLVARPSTTQPVPVHALSKASDPAPRPMTAAMVSICLRGRLRSSECRFTYIIYVLYITRRAPFVPVRCGGRNGLSDEWSARYAFGTDGQYFVGASAAPTRGDPSIAGHGRRNTLLGRFRRRGEANGQKGAPRSLSKLIGTNLTTRVYTRTSTRVFTYSYKFIISQSEKAARKKWRAATGMRNERKVRGCE